MPLYVEELDQAASQKWRNPAVPRVRRWRKVWFNGGELVVGQGRSFLDQRVTDQQ